MTVNDGWGRDTSPFHEGEQIMQARYGLKDHREAIGKRIMRPYIPEQHREFFEQLPFAIVGSVDSKGQPWASIVFGEPGFLSTPTNETLDFNTALMDADPLKNNLDEGKPLSLLGIELPTRRRNRINMISTGTTESGFGAKVVQSFGNCPKYIQTRAIDFTRDPSKKVVNIDTQHFTELPSSVESMITNADTLFVASHNHKDDQTDTGGVDVNHRGGQKGFVKVEGNTLTIPDYSGNYLFNTLGNFLINPKAGLLFIDFKTGDICYLTGTTEILWEDHPEVEAFKGADRGWKFNLEVGFLVKNASPVRGDFNEYAPTSVETGTWNDAENVLALMKKTRQWLTYDVTKIVDEDELIRSFYLQPQNMTQKLPFKAGQSLALKLKLDGANRFIGRNYTVSSAPTDPFLRISVKREIGVGEHPNGQVSNYLHDNIAVGSTIEAKGPAGLFVVDKKTQRPVVLIGAGVGVTPIVSMFRDLALAEERYIQPDSVTVIQVSRKASNLVFNKEFDSLKSQLTRPTKYFSVVSQPDSDEKESVDFDYQGHLTVDLLKKMLPDLQCDFYVCGPAGFMQSTYDALLSLGINDQQVYTESFGPAALKRKNLVVEEQLQIRTDTKPSTLVAFSDSKTEHAWTNSEGTLLEFAESHGLKPDFSCRNGVCGECATRIIKGEVVYKHKPTFEAEKSEVLICCAVPANGQGAIELKL